MLRRIAEDLAQMKAENNERIVTIRVGGYMNIISSKGLMEIRPTGRSEDA